MKRSGSPRAQRRSAAVGAGAAVGVGVAQHAGSYGYGYGYNGHGYEPPQFRLLRLAEYIFSPAILDDPSALAVTLNNSACLLRKEKRPQEALDCLNRAFEIEFTCAATSFRSQSVGTILSTNGLGLREVLKTNKSLADTLINTSTVLSELGRHLDAVGCIKRVIEIARESMRNLSRTASLPHFSQADADAEAKASSAVTPISAEDLSRLAKGIYQVLAAAYYNLGVQQEFLSMRKQSLASFQKGQAVADHYVGVGSSIALALREATASVSSPATAAAAAALQAESSVCHSIAAQASIDTSAVAAAVTPEQGFAKARRSPKKKSKLSTLPQINHKQEKEKAAAVHIHNFGPPYSNFGNIRNSSLKGGDNLLMGSLAGSSIAVTGLSASAPSASASASVKPLAEPSTVIGSMVGDSVVVGSIVEEDILDDAPILDEGTRASAAQAKSKTHQQLRPSKPTSLKKTTNNVYRTQITTFTRVGHTTNTLTNTTIKTAVVTAADADADAGADNIT